MPNTSTSPTQRYRPSSRVRFWRWVFQIRSFDKLLQRRAQDLFAKARLDEYLSGVKLYADIGSGSGHFSELIARRCTHPPVRCVGVDLAWHPIERVRRRLTNHTPSRCLFTQADGTRLPLPDSCADAAGLCFVLHHIPYQLQDHILTEITRILRPGGTLVLLEDTPAPGDARQWKRVERWDRWQNFESRHEPHYYRSTPDWKNYLAQRDFDLVHEKFFDRMIPQMFLGAIPHTAFVFRRRKV